ncbi:MAG TPA: ABC transporter substrate-binding protein [Burkholderiales bacterium]
MKRVMRLAFLLLPAVAFAAIAQPAPVIGYLGPESPELFASRLAAFKRGLAETNYAEARNVNIEYRWAYGDNARLPALAAELVARKVSVLVATGSAAGALAAKKASSTIPIVFEVGVDPVASGLVHSMNRPGGNATGVTSLNTGLGPKRLQLLRELVPGMKSFALLVNPTNPSNAEAMIDDLQVAAHAQRLQFRIVRAATESDLTVVFENLARERVDALVLANDTFFVHRSKEIAALALRHRIPAIHQPPEFVAAGGLVSYAGSFQESHRLAGIYTGRVLRGDKPADLPVQQVNKMELFVNAKTARALGLTVPRSIISRADRVIE